MAVCSSLKKINRNNEWPLRQFGVKSPCGVRCVSSIDNEDYLGSPSRNLPSDRRLNTRRSPTGFECRPRCRRQLY